MKKIIFISSLLILIFIIIFTYLSKGKNEDTYIVGNDFVSSVYKITGLKNISSSKISLENGVTTRTLTFEDSDGILQYAVKYADYLWKNEGYFITRNDNFGKENGFVELSKISKDMGKIVKISVDCVSNNVFKVTIKVGEGEIKIRK